MKNCPNVRTQLHRKLLTRVTHVGHTQMNLSHIGAPCPFFIHTLSLWMFIVHNSFTLLRKQDHRSLLRSVWEKYMEFKLHFRTFLLLLKVVWNKFHRDDFYRTIFMEAAGDKSVYIFKEHYIFLTFHSFSWKFHA